MIPILLVSRDQKNADKFIEDYIKLNNIPHHFIYKYVPELQVLKIEQIREVGKLFERQFPPTRLIVLYSFHTARPETQNAFLKTLEEKSEDAHFILVVDDEGQVLDTIFSRTKLIRLTQKVKKKTSSILKETFVQHLMGATSIKQEKGLKWCDELLQELHENIVNDINSRSQNAQLAKEVMRVKKLLERNNLNSQLAIDHLVFSIQRMKHET